MTKARNRTCIIHPDCGCPRDLDCIDSHIRRKRMGGVILVGLPFSEAHFATFPPELAERCILAGCPKGGLVLDPFGGSGTTALVALRHGRRAALIELNPDYAEMARRRIETEWRVPQRPNATDFGPLFSEAAE